MVSGFTKLSELALRHLLYSYLWCSPCSVPGVREGWGSESHVGLWLGAGSRKPVNAIQSLEILATINHPWHRGWHQLD